MKRLLLSMALLFVAGTVVFGAISGTAHDLRGTIGGSQVCVPCHTPHGGTLNAPLWNHTAHVVAVDPNDVAVALVDPGRPARMMGLGENQQLPRPRVGSDVNLAGAVAHDPRLARIGLFGASTGSAAAALRNSAIALGTLPLFNAADPFFT